jgi:4-amino-4-deoxy-L-arabinose transferase-like glycosyltransferase
MNKRTIGIPGSIWLILMVSLVLRLIIAWYLGPGYDEAYYYGYSLRPALSYFDHPPMVAFFAGIFPWITGIHSAFTIRLAAVILFTFTGLIFYRLAKIWLSDREAFIAFILFNITPIFSICAGVMILPDAPLSFFWTAALICLWKVLKHEKNIHLWVIGGVLNGLALLSKYHGIMLAFFLVVYILIYRRWLIFQTGPYLYGFCSLLLFLPVFIWNYQHEFVSFLFQGGRLTEPSINVGRFLVAFSGQAIYLTPFVFLPALYIMWRTYKKGVRDGDDTYRFYFFFGTMPVLVFNLIAPFRPILPHWTLPGYIVLMLPLAQWISEKTNARATIRHWTRVILVVIILAYVAVLFHARYGIFHLEKGAARGWFSHEIFEKDLTLDYYGWEAVAPYLEKNAITPENYFLFTRKWFLSGQVELATQGRFIVSCFNRKQPLNYQIWDARHDLRGKDGIFITTSRHFSDPHKYFNKYFESISELEKVIVKRGGVPSRVIYFYRCHRLKMNFR